MSSETPEVAAAAAPAPEGEAPAVPEAEAKEIPKYMKKPRRPDNESYEVKRSKLLESIQATADQIKVLKDTIGSKMGQGSSPKQVKLKNQIEGLRGKFQQLLKQKDLIREELKACDKQKSEMAELSKSLRSKAGFTSVEDIDTELARLEHKLNYSDVGGVQAEKKIIDQIKRLAEAKKSVSSYQEKAAELQGAGGVDKRGAIMDRLKAKDAEIDAVKAEENGLKDELSALRAADMETSADIPALKEEKQELWEVIQALRAEMDKLKAEKDGEWTQYKSDMDAWHEWRKEDKKRKDIEYAKIRADREKERRAQDTESRGPPKYKEILRCDQLTAYLTKALPAEASAEVVAEAPKAVEGMMLMTSKKSKGDDDDDVFSSLSAKKKKGKGAKKSKAKAEGAKPDGMRMLAALDVELIAAFSQLKLDIPKSIDEVRTTIATIAQKKAEFENVQKVALAKREAGEPDEEEEEEEEAEAEAEPKAEEAEEEDGEKEKGPVALELKGDGDESADVTMTVTEADE